jgi:hypothetical protein
MKKIISTILLSFLCVFNTFSQSRKDQIITLNQKADSLELVISNERQFTKEIVNELELKISNYKKEIIVIEEELSGVKKELTLTQAKKLKEEKVNEQLRDTLRQLNEEKIRQDSINSLMPEIFAIESASKSRILDLPNEFNGRWTEDFDDCENEFGLFLQKVNGIIKFYGHEWSADVTSIFKLENDFIEVSIKGDGWAGDEEYEIEITYVLKIIGDKMYFHKDSWGLVSNAPYNDKKFLKKCP